MEIYKIEKRLLRAFETRRRLHIDKNKRMKVQQVIKSIFKEVYNEIHNNPEGSPSSAEDNVESNSSGCLHEPKGEKNE